MKRDRQTIKIIRLLWILVVLAMFTGTMINVLVGDAITKQNEAAVFADKRSKVVFAIIVEIETHFRSVGADILSILDTENKVKNNQPLNKYSKFLAHVEKFQDNYLDENNASSMVLSSIVERFLELKKSVTLWRSRYDELALDLSQGLSRNIARDILLQMRGKIISRIGEQRIKAALVLNRYHNANDELATELSHQIVEEHNSYVKNDLSHILIRISSIERLVEIITNERHYDTLVSLKENQLHSTLELLKVDISNLANVDVYRNDRVIFNEFIEAFTTAVFGEGYRLDKQHESIVPGVGGLYNLHEKHSRILLEQAVFHTSLSKLMADVEIEAGMLEREALSVEKIVSLVTGLELERAWRKTLVLSAIGAILFLLVVLLISNIVRKQLLILVNLRNDAEAANKTKSQFLAAMSHEIRTPMNGMLGMAELLSYSEMSKKQKHYVARIQQSGNHLLNLINEILDFSKVEAGEMKLHAENFNAGDMLFDIRALMSKQLQEKNIKLTIKTPDPCTYISGDNSRLRQVLLNVIGNAIKFTENGEINIDFKVIQNKEDSLTLQYVVSDTGIGIERNVLEHVFDVFSQADSTTTRKYGGSGLGLSISKQLIELMGGEINASSTAGEGTVITFTVKMKAVTKETVRQSVLST